MEEDYMDLKKTKDMKKRALQVILPITLLSFLLSCYYFSCISCFIHSQNLAIKCFIQNNKCLFLASNIIIIFLAAADAGLLISSSSIYGNGLYDEYVTHVASQYQQNSQIMEVDFVTQISGHDQEQNTNDQVLKVEFFEEEKVIEQCVHQSMNLIMVEDGGEGEKEEDEEEEEEEVLEVLGIDDLNKRFDEFIAREKKKWKLEALKLVMV